MYQRLSRMKRAAIERRLRGDGGFTLIELLVVIAILGVLSAVVVFSVGGVRDKGASSASKQDVRTLRTAQEAFYAKNGRYGSEAELAAGGFIKGQSGLHDILRVGDSSYDVICSVAQNSSCGADGATPRGGTIRVSGGNGASVSGDNFVNPAVTSGGGVHPNVEYMFNGLMRWAENNTPQPDLAQSFTISPDQKTYTFVLRPDSAAAPMEWHDGAKITSADVEFSFQEALLKFHGRTAASVGPALGVTGEGATAVTPANAITTPNASTVVFNFQYAYAPLLRQMNVTEAPIIPQHVYGPCRTDGAGAGSDNIQFSTCAPNNPGSSSDLTQPAGSLAPPYGTGSGQIRHIGSGPFMLKSRNTTTGTLILVKNPRYHFPGLPMADEVQQLSTTNGGDALRDNAVDVAGPGNNRILPIVAPQLSADITPAAGFTLVQPPRGAGGGNCILTKSFNLWRRGDTPAQINAGTAQPHPIFGDPTTIPPNAAAGRPNPMTRGQVVRTALAMATNRQALFNNNQFGKGQLATSPFHSKVPGYKPTALPSFDVAKAAQWLTDAGWINDGGGARLSDHSFGTGVGAVSAGVTRLTFELIAGSGSTPGSQQVYGDQMATQWNDPQIRAGMTVTGQTNAVISQSRFADRQYDMITVSYCNGDDPVIGVRRQYYAGLGTTAGSQISATGFTNAAGYRSATMDALWDAAAQGSPSAHAGIQDEAAANVPYIWLDESLGSRAWRTSKCSGFNNNNTGLFVETGACTS